MIIVEIKKNKLLDIKTPDGTEVHASISELFYNGDVHDFLDEQTEAVWVETEDDEMYLYTKVYTDLEKKEYLTLHAGSVIYDYLGNVAILANENWVWLGEE